MQKYTDRKEAGAVLAEQLKQYANQKNVIVLGLARGGIPVAAEIARALHVPLDVFIVRKLGVPGHEELAMGAIAREGAIFFNDDIIRELAIPKLAINQVIASEQAELARRELAYRGERPFPAIENKIVILVDDGIATGATMHVAIEVLRKLNPAKIVVAVPVAEKNIAAQMTRLADEVVCPMLPEHFYAVGAWYDVFDQTDDSEVHALLKEAQQRI